MYLFYRLLILAYAPRVAPSVLFKQQVELLITTLNQECDQG